MTEDTVTPPSRPGRWPPLLAGAAALAILAPVSRAPWFWDDHVHLLLGRELPLDAAWRHGLLGVYFRPLGEAALWLVARLPGLTPFLSHLPAALAAALTAALAAVLVLRATDDGPAAAAAGLLAAVAPPSVAGAAWLANLPGALAGLLGIASLAAVSRPCAAVLLALAAAASKEDGILWLPAVFVLAAARRGTPRGRPAAAAVLAGVGTAALLAWRRAVLGGPGGRLPVLPGGPLALAGLAAAAGAAVLVLRLVRPPMARAALATALAGSVAAAALHPVVPPDPHGLRWRLLTVPVLAGSVAAGILLGTARGAARTAGFALAAAALAGSLAVSVRWERDWLHATAASGRLVRATVRTLEAPGAPAGPVWIDDPASEIALAAAVYRSAPELAERSLPLRPLGANLLVARHGVWREALPALWPARLPGNPMRVDGWIAALMFPRPERLDAFPILRPRGEEP